MLLGEQPALWGQDQEELLPQRYGPQGVGTRVGTGCGGGQRGRVGWWPAGQSFSVFQQRVQKMAGRPGPEAASVKIFCLLKKIKLLIFL